VRSGAATAAAAATAATAAAAATATTAADAADGATATPPPLLQLQGTGSSFGTPLSDVRGLLALSEPLDGGAELLGEYTGRLVLMWRGGCSFTDKVRAERSRLFRVYPYPVPRPPSPVPRPPSPVPHPYPYPYPYPYHYPYPHPYPYPYPYP
jgi:hypothetical protein